MERGNIIQELIKAYSAELQTVENYMAASVNLDGVRLDVIKNHSRGYYRRIHAGQRLAARVKTVGGTVPGSLALHRDQSYLQPPQDPTDVVTVIKGVITAEEAFIANYNRITRGNSKAQVHFAAEMHP